MAKVLGLVTFKVFPADMGGQKGVADFYIHLSEYQDVVLAVTPGNTDGRINMYPLLHANRVIHKNAGSIRRLKKLAMEEQASVIIAEHSYAGWIAWLVAKTLRLPFIIHSHNIEAFRFKKMNRSWWKFYRAYEKWIHRKADHNFFISQEDMHTAIQEFRLQPQKCSVITYGIHHTIPFSSLSQPAARIFLFNGSLDYFPNHQAVMALIEQVNPLLRQKLSDYRIIISGKGASEELLGKMQDEKEIEYAGFVKDLGTVFRNAAVFLNPVLNDTGIKTKVVEAIGNHCTVVSTASGANGMETSKCGNKLRIVADGDWNAFAETAIACLGEERTPAPAEYFEHYSWKAITAKASSLINKTIQDHKATHIYD